MLAEAAERLITLRNKREQILQQVKQLLQCNESGTQLARKMADSTERLVLELLERRLEKLTPADRRRLRANVALVVVAGLGRREMAPYSDVDLLILCRSRLSGMCAETISAFVRDCWDCGLTLGHSIRTVPETLADAKADPHLATALLDARLLWGEPALSNRLLTRFRRQLVDWRRSAFVELCIRAREEERLRHGATAQQLEPNVKRSVGGLRDLHLIRWVSVVKFGTYQWQHLVRRNVLSPEEVEQLKRAANYLWRVRFELHFAAEKAHDTLTRRYQLQMADKFCVEPKPGQLPVECFMQEYFRHTSAVADCVRHFVELHRPKPLKKRVGRFLTQHRTGEGFLVSATDVDLPVLFPNKPKLNSLEEILGVFRLAALHNVDLSPRLERLVKLRVAQLPPCPLSETAASLFLEILASPGNLGNLLRSMYATGVLELVLPEMRHARCLLQFNQYHAFTVDEHTFRTIEALEEFEQEDEFLSTIYRQIRHKEILHLALLLHDLGKGYEQDHCEVGKQLAQEVARRLRLTPRETDRLVFLVHQHLLIPQLEFWRDTTEPSVLLDFARKVGSAERLRMLLVLTAADLAAVGPGVWTSWKRDVLRILFKNTLEVLGGTDPEKLRASLVDRTVTEILNAEPNETEHSPEEQKRLTEQLKKQLEGFSTYYLATTSPQRIAADLKAIQQLKEGEIWIDAKYDSHTRTVDYRVITDRRHAEGCFHRIAGALTAQRLTILSASINTTADGVVVDQFRVLDNDYKGPPPQIRIQEVSKAIRAVLQGETTVKELFQRQKRFVSPDAEAGRSNLPTQVVIDNDTSDRCTVIDVFAHDRPGLLYTIGKTIYDLGLSVELAKIGTHFDQVVDVFYVTENQQKIQNERRLEEVGRTLEKNISEFERSKYVEFV